MKVRGVPASEFAEIVQLVSHARYGGNVIIKTGPNTINRRGDFTITFRAVSSRGAGARGSWSGRKSIAVCWHAFRDVYAETFRRYPKAKIETMYATYNGAAGFMRDYPATAERNIGSMIQHAYPDELCECGDTEIYTDPCAAISAEVSTGRLIMEQTHGLTCWTAVGCDTDCPAHTDDSRADGGCRLCAYELGLETLPAEVKPAPDNTDWTKLSPAEWLELDFTRNHDKREYRHDYIADAIARYSASPNQELYYPYSAADDESGPDYEPVVSPAEVSLPTNYHSRIWLCHDCYFTHHGFDLPCEPGCATETGDDCNCRVSDPLSDIPYQFHITDGMLNALHDESCLIHIHGRGTDFVPDDYECSCDTIDFSTRDCDGCRSHLAGERHAVTLWFR